MALINCPECNREVSDIAKKCPHCGYTLQEMAKERLKKTVKEKRKLIRNIVISLVALGCVFAAVIIYMGMPHGKEEKMVQTVVKCIQEDLLVPESMEVIECYTYNIDASLSDYEEIAKYDNMLFCYVYYKAENKSGGYTDDFKYAQITPKGEVSLVYEAFVDYVESLFEYGYTCSKLSEENYKTFNLMEHTKKANKWLR